MIRSISLWFTRVVYERDAWNDQLAEWSHSIDIRIGWVLYLTRLCVWLTRKILWVLMLLGHLVSGCLLRQMEFDADRHEARLPGTRTFATTARQEAEEIKQGRVEAKLAPFEQAVADRLYAGLSLARTKTLAASLVKDGFSVAEIDQLLEMFQHVNERLGQLLMVRDSLITMGKLLSILSDNNDNEKLIDHVCQSMQKLFEHITDLVVRLRICRTHSTTLVRIFRWPTIC